MGPSNQTCRNVDGVDLKTLGVICVLDKSNTVINRVKNLLRHYESSQTLIKIEALNLGIIPSCNTQEIHNYLESVTHEEGVRLKRKFRKIQRKYRKKHASNDDHVLYGISHEPPTRYQKQARKALVFNSIAIKIYA